MKDYLFLKRIIVRKDVYKKLKELKTPKESFSTLIGRLIEYIQKNPSPDFKITKDMTEDFLREFF